MELGACTNRTLFAGARIFDGTGARPTSADVVVQGGRIVDVGSGLDGDRCVRLEGCTLLPGLIDCHVHVILSHVDFLRMLNTPLSYRLYEAARNLRTLLASGITTVRDAAGADLGVKRAVDDGLILGPRMQIAIGMICQTGGHNDGWMLSGARAQTLFPIYPGVPESRADGPEEVRRTVREMLRSGADVIKIATSGGVLSPRDRPQHAHYRFEEVETAVREARAAGVSVMSHAQAREGVKTAVAAGVRSIEHGFDLDDEAIELMLRAGTYLVPTLSAPLAVVEAAARGDLALEEGILTKAKEIAEYHQVAFRRAVEAGVKIALGSDSGITPHGENLRELGLMTQAGMTPAQSLRAATQTAAELLGWADDVGTIREGLRADFLIVNGDALEIEALPSRIIGVYKGGELVARRASHFQEMPDGALGIAAGGIIDSAPPSLRSIGHPLVRRGNVSTDGDSAAGM